MLTQSQRQAVKAGLQAETDPAVVEALSIRNDTFLAAWCNGLSSVDAWAEAVTARELFEAADVAKFDNLSAGKRESQRRIEDFAPHDFGRQKMRKALQDIWGNTESIPILEACRRKATRAEVYITPNVQGNQATTNTVVGLKLTWSGQVTIDDIGRALN